MNISCIYPLKKLHEPHLSAAKEYEKRLARYCKYKFLALESYHQEPDSDNLIYITGGYNNSELPTSEEFAAFLERRGLHGKATIHFLLTETPPNFDRTISLSYAKLPIPTLAVLLSEQVYRAFRIIHHHSYHK